MSKKNKKTEIDEQEALSNQFIMEVDEDIKDENLRKFGKKISWVVAIICIVIVAIVGYFQYEKSQNKKQADRDSYIYQQALILKDSSKNTEALKKLNEVIKNNGKYKVIASMTKAQILTEESTEKAFSTYVSVFKDKSTPEIYKNISLVHAGYIAVTKPKLFSKIKDDVTKYSTSTNKFKYSFLEILAWESIDKKDYTGAKGYLNIILADTKSPNGMKSRSKIILESLNADMTKVKTKTKVKDETETKVKAENKTKTKK